MFNQQLVYINRLLELDSACIVSPGQHAAHVAAPTNLVLLTRHLRNRLRIGHVLLGQYPRCQRARVIGLEDRDCPLHNDCAVVEFFVDKVHGAARGFCAIIEGLLLRIEAG